MKHKTFILIATAILLVQIVWLTGCMATPHVVVDVDAPAGLFKGVWHGIISVFTFILSLFSDNVTVYECNNDGTWYNLGFLLGIGAFSKSIRKW